MAGPIATFLGLGAAEDAVNSIVLSPTEQEQILTTPVTSAEEVLTGGGSDSPQSPQSPQQPSQLAAMGTFGAAFFATVAAGGAWLIYRAVR